VTKRRYGRFRREDRRFFLALRGDGPTLLELDPARAGSDVVAVSLAEAGRVAAEVATALG
jgi:hypothetical protein